MLDQSAFFTISLVPFPLALIWTLLAKWLQRLSRSGMWR